MMLVMKGEKRFGRQNILRPKIFDHNFFIDQPGHAQSRWLERAHKTTHWKVFRNFFFFIEKYIWHVFMLLYLTLSIQEFCCKRSSEIFITLYVYYTNVRV